MPTPSTPSLEDFTYEYVLSEIRKLQYTYRLNKVIRYNFTREEKHQTQSVAEHVCNMLFLAHYFRPLEDPEHKLDFARVVRMIMMHDMGEIETGDVLAIAKTNEDRDVERYAISKVKTRSPQFVSDEIENLYEDFEQPTTREAEYAKAIDKLDGQIFWMEPDAIRMVIAADESVSMDIAIAHPMHIKKITSYLQEKHFPFILKFLEVIDEEKWKTGLLGKRPEAQN